MTLASLHIAACTPNFIIQESLIPIGGNALWDEMLVEPLVLKDGYVDLPQAPGIGIKFDESIAERYPFRGRDTSHPVLADGSVGDW